MSRLTEVVGGQVKLAMFDLDGTLVDSVPGIAAAVDRMLADLGSTPVGEEQVRQWVGSGQWALAERALAHANLDVDRLGEQALSRFRLHYASTAKQGLSVYPGVIEFLHYLQQRGVQLAVVTNKPKEYVPDILAVTDLARFFSETIGGECLPVRKPDPLPLLTIMSRFRVASHQAIMVGDSSNDLLAARAARVPALAVTYGYSHNQDLRCYHPQWLGANLAELLLAT